MKTTGCVFEGQRFRSPDTVAPPDVLPDVSRFGNDGVFTDITWERLPSGLWVMDFNGATSIITIGDIGVARTIEFWILIIPKVWFGIFEELAATGVSIFAFALVYPSWDNCFINAVIRINPCPF